MSRLFYTALYFLLLPFILLRLWLRARRAPAYRQRIAERFGFFSAPDLRDPIWVHAVSVGETIAAAAMIKQLQADFPDRDLVVTTMTPTGSERVKALFGDCVFHVYAPYDFPGAIRRFLQRINPGLLVIMETELWPNTIYYCRQRQVPVVVANARLSAKSAAGYQKFSALTRPMLKDITLVVAQTRADAERFQSLGLPPTSLMVSGSIKFDIAIEDSLKGRAEQLKASLGARPVWIAASTHQGEDEQLLHVHKQLLETFPDLLLVLVPRHPERFDRVAEAITREQLSFARRSQSDGPSAAEQVLLGDTMGELLLLYGVADMAFVGGSLVANGGHNMLEPAAWALPIVTGNSDFNFAGISEKLQQQGALVKVSSADGMVEIISQWLQCEEKRQLAGDAAAQVVAENRGALEKLLRAIKSVL